jgi:uroporphyrinogen decarboxylase
MKADFLKACRGERIQPTPVWMMRQAGRYLPEYRALRERHDFWTMVRTPELAVEVTLQPVERLGVDAAILFSDILVVFPPMGCPVRFAPGPVLERPVRSRDDVERLRVPEPGELGFVLEAIRVLRRELEGRVPLIGFGGAPLTLAAYLVEGGGSKDFAHLKALLYERPEVARALLERVTAAQERFLSAQVEAGAQAIQIFDTWGGILSRHLYEGFALEPVRRLVARLRALGVPVIYFIKNGSHLLDLVGRIGADVVSVDEKLPLDRVAELLGPGPALQGNLDPMALLADGSVLRAEVRRVLEAVPEGRAHVFNLGHGILPQTPVEHARLLVELVHAWAPQGPRGRESS